MKEVEEEFKLTHNMIYHGELADFSDSAKAAINEVTES